MGKTFPCHDVIVNHDVIDYSSFRADTLNEANCQLYLHETDAIDNSDLIAFGQRIGDISNPFVIEAQPMPVWLSVSWWRHQMEAFSALLAICAGNSPVNGKSPAQRPVTRSFDVFFDLCLNKRLSKQSWVWWFETPWRSLWRHWIVLTFIRQGRNGNINNGDFEANNAALQWRHNGCDSVSNHQSHDCLLNRLFRPRSKKTSKLRVTGLCAGNSPGTSEFPAQMANYAENVSNWWRHHG